MYLLLKNPNVPDFLNAAAAAAGILQLSINSFYDIRCRKIHLKFTVICGIIGGICLFLSVIGSSKAGTSSAAETLLWDLLKKAACLFFLALFCRISRGGIGGGDILSLLSLAGCFRFHAWMIAGISAFGFAFCAAVLLFFIRISRPLRHPARAFSIPFLPFLLAGSVFCLILPYL